jgi:Asp-tRNA(Asn)/Glu-tRNA(Gln) amidotransferase A subunit family amidase
VAVKRRTCGDFAEAYRTGRRSPREVAERALAFAAEVDRLALPLRPFAAIDPRDVRAQADAAALRWKRGVPRSPLDGVPVAIKDEYDVRGYPTTRGTAFLGATPATADALTVARLRDAGCVILGKTNLSELGVYPTGHNLRFGPARNPWDPTRDTGGSSSGSAVALAIGLCPIALGTDSGGSVRTPAALCGVPSLKPSWGRLPLDGVPQLDPSLEHLGPMAGTVDDLRLAFATLTGEDMPLPATRPLRVGMCASWWAHAAPEIDTICRAAVVRLCAAGASEIALELPHIELANAAGTVTFLVEAARTLAPHLAASAPFSPAVRAGLEFGSAIPPELYYKAQRARTLIARDFAQAFTHADVILSPTTPIAAPRYHLDALSDGELNPARTDEMIRYAFPYNLTGLPAAQVPCGFTAAGLPVGLQIAAPRGQEQLALAVAREVEHAAELRLPPVHVDLLA